MDADDAINDVSPVRVHLVAQDQDGQPLMGAIAEASGLGTQPEPTPVDPATRRAVMKVDREA